jgi:hypothetical protein
MMRFEPAPEPSAFDARCRQRGKKWLKAHPDYDRPYDYWSEFEADVRAAFHGLCAYCVMTVMKAQIDHFIPVALLKKRKQDALAFEWSNFRYGDGFLNQKKAAHEILDPFRVKDDWFKLLLPSLQLVLTDKVPKRQQKKAAFTLERLGLIDSEVIVRYRQQWFEMYRKQELTLEGLRQVAPLIARAVERDMANGKDWRYPAPAK